MFTSQQMNRNVIVTNKKGKHELTDEFLNHVTLKKISKIHGITVHFPVFYPKENIINSTTIDRDFLILYRILFFATIVIDTLVIEMAYTSCLTSCQTT